MVVNGREIGFFHSVEAHCEICAMCPGHDIGKFGDALTSDYLKGIEMQRAFILALNKGFEMRKHYENPDYTPNPLTEQELMMMGVPEFVKLFEAAGNAFAEGSEQAVETEEPKGKKTANVDGKLS